MSARVIEGVPLILAADDAVIIIIIIIIVVVQGGFALQVRVFGVQLLEALELGGVDVD